MPVIRSALAGLLALAVAATVFVVAAASEPAAPAPRPATSAVERTRVDVPYVKRYMVVRCRSIRGFNCWWRDPNPSPPNWSFYSIPIGRNRKCLNFWAPRVNTRYGFCTRPSARASG